MAAVCALIGSGKSTTMRVASAHEQKLSTMMSSDTERSANSRRDSSCSISGARPIIARLIYINRGETQDPAHAGVVRPKKLFHTLKSLVLTMLLPTKSPKSTPLPICPKLDFQMLKSDV